MQNQLFEMVQDNPELMEKLKQASKQFWWRIPVQISKKDGKVVIQAWNKASAQASQTNSDPRKMIFEDEDWVEVFDADDIGKNAPSEWVVLPTRKKVRPNDPCPCGSGKKYKKCHWADEEK
jgi:uncharacterized protein YecA (UPF0149 family)